MCLSLFAASMYRAFVTDFGRSASCVGVCVCGWVWVCVRLCMSVCVFKHMCKYKCKYQRMCLYVLDLHHRIVLLGCLLWLESMASSAS